MKIIIACKNYTLFLISSSFFFFNKLLRMGHRWRIIPSTPLYTYDNGYRILLGEHPVKDYWIVHGYIN